jgi:hypothetical protein
MKHAKHILHLPVQGNKVRGLAKLVEENCITFNFGNN